MASFSSDSKVIPIGPPLACFLHTCVDDTMASCERLTWLQVVGVNKIRLLDPGQMSQLVGELRNAANQQPSQLLFVGQHTKNLALWELFLNNNFKKGFCNGVATLWVDNASTYSEYPIFFAESCPSQATPLMAEDAHTCKTESFSVQWAEDMNLQYLYNILHARLFCLFTDVICVFADDFAVFNQVVQLLKSWAAVGSASVHFEKLWLRVVIVRRGDEASPSPTYDLLTMKDLQHGLHCRSLKEFFSSIKVLHLAAEQLSSLTCFWQLKKLLWREADEMRLIWHSLSCLYSAVHVSQFFRMAVAHTAASLSQPFDFVLTSRWGNEVQPDFIHHLSRFLQVKESHQTPCDALMAFIASNILLDAYSPKMHGKIPLHLPKISAKYLTKFAVFNSEIVYDVQYRQFCLQTLTEIYNDAHLIQQQDAFIWSQLVTLFFDMIASEKSTIQMHQDKVRSLDINWTLFKSNQTCYYCLQQTSEHSLSYEHVICDVCVRNVGYETLTFDSQYWIDVCLFCCTEKLIVGLRPFTAELQILSINNRETHEVIAVGIMNLLQSILRSVWRIQNLFDIAYDTSVDTSDDDDETSLSWSESRGPYCVDAILTAAVSLWLCEPVWYSGQTTIFFTDRTNEQFQLSSLSAEILVPWRMSWCQCFEGLTKGKLGIDYLSFWSCSLPYCH